MYQAFICMSLIPKGVALHYAYVLYQKRLQSFDHKTKQSDI